MQGRAGSFLRLGQKNHIPFLPHPLPSDLRVNLALAYTELTEELGRLRELSSLQGRILRTLLQEQAPRNAGETARAGQGPQCGEQGRWAQEPPPHPWVGIVPASPWLATPPRYLFPRPKALAAVAAPLPGPRVPLALPACQTAALCPVPVPSRAAPLAGAPLPFASAAPLARLALLPVAGPTAPLAGAAIVPVTQPAAPLAGATQLPGPAAPAAAAPRREDAGRARLRQAAQPPRQGRLPGPPQLLGAGGGRGLRQCLPRLAAGRGRHAPQAPSLRRRALRPRQAAQPAPRLRGHPPAL